MSAGIQRPEARWADLQANKLEWAYRAYRRFIDELSEDVREHLTHGAVDQEPYVVVFGRTQVGKTTLLLELMGVDVQAQARVGTVLRGGRESGKSATATTMEYRRSRDRDWHLDDGSGPRRFASDDAMCEALGELRLRMSERRLHAENPVVVSIPEDCFSGSAEGGIGARMLDLPGDSPADEVEQEHVTRMARRYVPHADLILLVGRGDDLSFLDPDALTLPGIDDWQFVPNRFRIVTTFSFTPHTVRQFARDHDGELAPAHVRERLLKQIHTFERPLAPEAARSERFFPLEFGQSWQAMLRDDSQFATRVGPVVAELTAQLHADIRASANEAARFRNALDVNIVAERKRAACVAQWQADMAALAALAEQAEALAHRAGASEQKAAKQLAAIRAVLALRSSAEQELSCALAVDPAEHVKGVDGATTNTSALFSRINDFTSWLRQQFLETLPSGSEARKFFGATRPDLSTHLAKVNTIAEDEFAALRARMNDYWRNEYYPSMSDSFSNDKSRLKQDMGDAATKTATLAKTLWRKHIVRRVAELEEEAREADGERAAMELILAQKRAELKELALRRAEAQAEMERETARLDRDAETAKRFATMLAEEYLAELRSRQARIASAATPADALLTLLSVESLHEERCKITQL